MAVTLVDFAADAGQVRTERLVFVDALRVSIVAFVIVHHAAQAYGSTGGMWPIHDPAQSDWFRPFYIVNAACGLGLLFLLAGYFVPSSCVSLAPAFARRDVRSELRRLHPSPGDRRRAAGGHTRAGRASGSQVRVRRRRWLRPRVCNRVSRRQGSRVAGGPRRRARKRQSSGSLENLSPSKRPEFIRARPLIHRNMSRALSGYGYRRERRASSLILANSIWNKNAHECDQCERTHV